MIGAHAYGQLEGLEIIEGCARLPISRVMDAQAIMSRAWHKLTVN